MITDVIRVGEKIRLTRQPEEKGRRLLRIEERSIEGQSYGLAEENTIYYSRVVQILDENKIKVAMPMVNGKYTVLGFLEKYRIEFFTKKGIYRCDGKVVSRFKDTRTYYLVFELLTEFEKLQRREYYRLDCLLQIKFKRSMEGNIYKKENSRTYADKAQEEQEAAEQEALWHPAVMTNISGGGAKFNSAEKMNRGEKILLKMHLTYENGDKDFEIPAEVISSSEVNYREDVIETRVQYVDISVRQREEIVRFVFDEERRIRKRKKGLI